MLKYLKLILFSLIIIISGCSNKTNTSRKPVTNIQITPANNIVVWGNEFSISIESKIKKMKIEKIDLYINNQLIKTSDNESLNIKINSKEYLPGKLSLKVETTNNDGITGTNYVTLLILSDLKPEKLNYEVVGTLPHNPKNFTEGFEFFNGKILESTGNIGESYIYSYNAEKGNIYNTIKLDNQYFGEGITVLDNKIYQLTYTTKIGFIYDAKTFTKTGEFNFESEEGWGMTNDGKYLIMSDGTSKIHFIDPVTFKRVKSIEVCDNNGVIDNINELEYVDGVIYSNIWMTQTILKIDSENGRVMSYINMTGLQSQFNTNQVDVLNGIAYNRNDNLFYITGKYWPKIFKVRFK